MFEIAYSKLNKRFVAKSVKEEKIYEYVKYIFRKIIKRVNVSSKIHQEGMGRIDELPRESDRPETK